MSHNPSDAVRATKTTKPALSTRPRPRKRSNRAKLGSFRQNSPIAAPYIAPDERPRDFAQLALACRREFQPANAEDEALVNFMTYLQWRVLRYRLTERSLREYADDMPEQSQALELIAQVIENLNQIGAWTMCSLQYLRKLQAFDTMEEMEEKALNPKLGSFRQNTIHPHGTHIPSPLPPETKPN